MRQVRDGLVVSYRFTLSFGPPSSLPAIAASFKFPNHPHRTIETDFVTGHRQHVCSMVRADRFEALALFTAKKRQAEHIEEGYEKRETAGLGNRERRNQ